jgi:hypothetical protein
MQVAVELAQVHHIVLVVGIALVVDTVLVVDTAHTVDAFLVVAAPLMNLFNIIIFISHIQISINIYDDSLSD